MGTVDDPELLDAFDDQLRPLGPLTRDVVHREGHWHQVIHVLVVRPNAPARVLLQRRLRVARSFPGLLDLSVTGHLSAGERPEDGLREVREEIGVAATFDDLVQLGQRLLADEAGEGRRNREIVHAFLLPLDRPLTSFDLRGCDVDGLVELMVDDLALILRDRDARVPGTELDASGTIAERTWCGADLVPDLDGYWAAVADAARRWVDGESAPTI